MKKNNRKGNLSDTGDKRKQGNTPTGKMHGTIDTAYHTAVSDDYILTTIGKSQGKYIVAGRVYQKSRFRIRFGHARNSRWNRDRGNLIAMIAFVQVRIHHCSVTWLLKPWVECVHWVRICSRLYD